nr:FAD-binding oxidoreductase [Flavimaribacter sediminis]
MIDSLGGIIGAERVLDDPGARRMFSEDISGEAAAPVQAIVQPASAEDVGEIVALARKRGIAILPRGGGMSYSCGYLHDAEALAFDLRDLSRVIEINEEARCVTVEAGCTWAKLYDALDERDLRTPFFGPLSGMAATIGGSLSQNGSFFGSGSYGYAAESVIGLEIADGTGALHRIGSWGARRLPALPRFGPDMVGAFLGDCGAFGVKTKALLRLIKKPPTPAFLSFSFDTSQQIVAAMMTLRDIPHLAEVWAFDKAAHRNLARSGFSVLESVGIASDIAGKSGSVLSAARNLVNAAGMRSARLDKLTWSLHIVVEPPLKSLLGEIADAASKTCAAAGGSPIPDTIPRVTRARPFRKIKALVGQDGERWLPCHGIFSGDAYPAALQSVEDILKNREADLEDHSIRAPILLASVGDEFIIEPQLMWPDSLSGFQRSHATDDQVKAHDRNEPRPQTRALALEIRREFMDLFAQRGGASMQIGRSYRYREDLLPGMDGMLTALKTALDPDGILNPGVLGLAPQSA